MEKEYHLLLKKYNFKTIVDFVSKNQNIDDPKQGSFSLGNVSVVSTDDHPLNQDTMIKVIHDSSIYSPHKNGRKTITLDEMRKICKTRNSITLSDDVTFEEGKGFGSVFALAKKQSISKIDESLSAAFQRDYFIFTFVNNILKDFPNKYLATQEHYERLFGNEMITGFAMVMLLYSECFEQKKFVLVPPFSKYESFFLEKFGDYVTFEHGKTKGFVPYVHCLIKIGKVYYIPSLGALHNRLSHLFYWHLKDTLKDINIFPNRFGEYFEEYVDGFLNNTVGKDYKRINKILEQHSKFKRPDFEIKKFNQSFIIECKSRLISLNDIKKKLYSGLFREDTVEGLKQLKDYKPTETNHIRILVLYEDSFPMIEFYEQAMREQNNLEDCYWIVTIDEFEAFMELDNEEDFRKAITKKMILQSNKKPISLSSAMRDSGVGKQYSRYYLTHIEGLINKKAKEILGYYKTI